MQMVSTDVATVGIARGAVVSRVSGGRGGTFGDESAGAVVERKDFLCTLRLVAQHQLRCLLLSAEVLCEAVHGAGNRTTPAVES